MNKYLNLIRTVISEKTGIEASEITEESYFEEDLNIGALELIDIINEIEESLKIDLIDERDKIHSVADLIGIIVDQLE